MRALRIILITLAFIAQPAHAGLFDELGAALRGDAKKETAKPDTTQTPAQTADNPTDSTNRNLTVTQTNNAASEQRIALVIGNSAYTNSPLKNPVNDAKDMAKKLRGLGFNVIERSNLKKDQIGGTLREFRSKLAPGAVALVFYAGHGLQIKGINYLPAVDADINSEEDVPNQSIAVNQIMDVLDESKTRLNLVFLDACRNNPYASRGFRSAERGLARVSAPSGTLISYATKPGSVAADGDGRNGLYTGKLLAQMDSNIQVEQTLKRVVTEVKAASQGKQEPWMEGSIEGDFCFAGCAAGSGTQVASLVPVPARTKTKEDIEDDYWDDIKDSNDLTSYEQYVKAYPEGRYLNLANHKIAQLKRKAQDAAPATAPPVSVQTPARIKKSGEEIEQDSWESVRDSGNISLIQEYLKEYPKGQYAGQARILIATLKAAPTKPADPIISPATPARGDNESALWAEAQKGNSREDYQAYLGQYPKGKYVALAKARLNKLDVEAAQQTAQQEQSAWDSANSTASEAGYQDYLNTYPKGRYATMAQGRITKLKHEAAQQATQQAAQERVQQAKQEREAAAQQAALARAEAARPKASGPVMVRIPGKNYEMGKYEVTQKEWREVMGSNPSKFSNCGDTCPVEQVSWNDAQEFISKLNAKTGKQYRLPTEAEWEYACYGGSQSEYCGGGNIDAVGWYDGNSGKTTHPVGQKQANGYGLYDMSGNVWEWMEDWYDSSQKYRVLRGGSWFDVAQYTRAAYRFSIDPARRDDSIGFRLARTLP